MAVQLHNSFGFQLLLCACWEEQSWNLLNAPRITTTNPTTSRPTTTTTILDFCFQHFRNYSTLGWVNCWTFYIPVNDRYCQQKHNKWDKNELICRGISETRTKINWRRYTSMQLWMTVLILIQIYWEFWGICRCTNTDYHIKLSCITYHKIQFYIHIITKKQTNNRKIMTTRLYKCCTQ